MNDYITIFQFTEAIDVIVPMVLSSFFLSLLTFIIVYLYFSFKVSVSIGKFINLKKV